MNFEIASELVLFADSSDITLCDEGEYNFFSCSFIFLLVILEKESELVFCLFICCSNSKLTFEANWICLRLKPVKVDIVNRNEWKCISWWTNCDRHYRSNIPKSGNKFEYSFIFSKTYSFHKIENENIPLCVIHEYSVFFSIQFDDSVTSCYHHFCFHNRQRQKQNKKLFWFQRRLMMKLLAAQTSAWFSLKWKNETNTI